MSQATQAALDEAIRAHVASVNEGDEDGSTIVTEWVVYSANVYVNRTNVYGYYREASENISNHALIGLTRQLALRTEAEFTFPDVDDED